MKTSKFWLLLPLLALLLLPYEQALATPAATRPAMDIPCLPIAYAEVPEECLLVGPAQIITQRAFITREIRQQTEWLRPTAEGLGDTNYAYLKVKETRGRIFSSLTAAIAGKHPSKILRNGFNYVTYLDTKTVDGKTYYHIGYNQWMRGGDIASHITPTKFSGVEVHGTPPRPFGWTLNYVYAYPTPETGLNISGTLDKYELIQVFDTVTVKGYEWYLVGPNQWIEQHKVALVYPRTEAPEGINNGRWIELNLFEQTTAVYNDGKLVFATLTTSGSTTYYTRPGLFQITEKLEVTPMRGAFAADLSDSYSLDAVPWTMYFDQRRAFHGEYWHDHLGYKSSHGCANLSFADAQWLYEWADLGDWVYVWDPSGKTHVLSELFTQLIGQDNTSNAHPKDFGFVGE